jgi:hypothetical protein
VRRLVRHRQELDLHGNPNKDDSTVLDGGRAGRVIVVDPLAVVRMTDLILHRTDQPRRT